MNIYKEYIETSFPLAIEANLQYLTTKVYVCCLFTDTYNKSVEHINYLADLAMEEFPDISTEDIEVTVLNGGYSNRVMAVEFRTEKLPNFSWIKKETLQPRK